MMSVHCIVKEMEVIHLQTLKLQSTVCGAFIIFSSVSVKYLYIYMNGTPYQVTCLKSNKLNDKYYWILRKSPRI